MPKTLDQAATGLSQLEITERSEQGLAQTLCDYLLVHLPVKGVQICQPKRNNLCLTSSGEPIKPVDFVSGISDLWQFLALLTRLSGFKPLSGEMLANREMSVFCCRLANTTEDSGSLLLVVDSQDTQLFDESKLNMFAIVLQNFWQSQSAELTASAMRRSIDQQYGLVLNQLQEETKKYHAMEVVANGLALLAGARSEFELIKGCVELIHEDLRFDRVGSFIIDVKDGCYHGVYGIDTNGQYRDERQDSYDYQHLADPFIQTLQSTTKLLHVEQEITLYNCNQPAGFGWNGMIVMRHEKETLGWFAIDNLFTRIPFDHFMSEALHIFATTVARFLVEIRHNSRVRLMATSLNLISNARHSKEICQRAVSFSTRELELDRVGIFLPADKEGFQLQGSFGVDTDGNVVDESSFSMERPKTQLAELAFKSPNKLIVLDGVPLFHERTQVGVGWNACLVVSIDEQVIAMICADNLLHRRLLTGQQRELFQLFAHNVGEMLSRARVQESLVELNASLEYRISERTAELEEANRKLAQAARHDSLTGIGNRRAYEETIAKEWSRQARSNRELTLVLMDLDGFKQVNDEHGHQVGDELLQRFGLFLCQHFRRASDTVIRLGGDEFAVIIADQSVATCKANLETICDNFVATLSDPFNEVTVSVGAHSMIPSSESSPDILFSRADKALYRAKALGKNQLVYYSTELEA